MVEVTIVREKRSEKIKEYLEAATRYEQQGKFFEAELCRKVASAFAENADG